MNVCIRLLYYRQAKCRTSLLLLNYNGLFSYESSLNYLQCMTQRQEKIKTASSRARPEVTDKFTHEMLQESLVVWYCLQYQAINLQISNISFLYPDCSARYKVILCLHMALTDSSPDLSLILWLHFNVIMDYFILVTLNVIAIVLNVYQLFWIP